MATKAPISDVNAASVQRDASAPAADNATLLGLLPGIALLAAVGYVGKFIEHSIAVYGKTHHLTLPNIEYVLWAILFGILIANTVGLPRIFRAGVATYEFWLKAGIILLGARFVLGDILKLSGISLALILVAFALSFAFMTWLGRAFSLSPRLTTLLSVGSSICGVSAIIATQGAIDADEEDSSTAIAAILALGAISLFTFPLIGHVLHMSDHAYGLWAGLAVDNTAEATAAGALYSDAAGKFAVLAKTCRNALIGFVVLAVAIQYMRTCCARRGWAARLRGRDPMRAEMRAALRSWRWPRRTRARPAGRNWIIRARSCGTSFQSSCWGSCLFRCWRRLAALTRRRIRSLLR